MTRVRHISVGAHRHETCIDHYVSGFFSAPFLSRPPEYRAYWRRGICSGTEGDMVNPPQVLVVDDERTAREILVLTFSLAGFVVESVDNGHEALRMVERLDPEVVVTDLHMPRMDGDELTDRLSERFGMGGPLVVVATADSSGADELGRDERFFAVLTKPLDPTELVRTVREAADARRCA